MGARQGNIVHIFAFPTQVVTFFAVNVLTTQQLWE